jgi:rhamnulokinase
MTTHYLACDLGATSGRLMLGTLAHGRIALEELHRFPNDLVKAGQSLHWDLPALFGALRTGLQQAAARHLPIASISTDAWGVDYLLYDAADQIIEPTFAYRDPRTEQGVKAARARASWETTYAETGIQFMALNTIYQLAAESPERLARARKLLLIGDAFNYYCSGVARHEESLASTSQLYNPTTKTWSQPLLAALGLPAALFTPVVPAGTRLGPLLSDLAAAVGLPALEVIATCSHDTGAAVAAVPASGERWAYLSSGTWSLLGVELPSPVITDQSRDLNFTNEVGYGSTVRFLKNIVGMWLVEECRREWAQTGTEVGHDALFQQAAAAPAFVSLINPNDPRFFAPDAMPAKIAAFCQETGQPAPGSPGATVRCVLESLALLYRRNVRQLEQLTGRKLECLHIVGGGSRNTLLNQFTANALQLPVLAGPTECTALGNVLVQAIALGHLPSLAAAREVVRNSFEVTPFQPQSAAEWNVAYARLEQLVRP